MAWYAEFAHYADVKFGIERAGDLKTDGNSAAR